jgi:N-acetylmuramoyl-L-alanine amidase
MRGFFLLILWSCIPLLSCISTAQAQNFTVVIDAGHGGKDPGAVGKIAKEKDINLKVALKLGELLKNQSDIKTIYTRKSDVFIALDRRTQIANEAAADLFVSIHTNALPNSRTYMGASTYTLGLSKSDANLAVAKRENAVIMYESDYQTRYAGFNPNSSESYIIFEFMQDKYMSQSVHLADLLQRQFKSHCKRTDRGVHQAGFLVLKTAAMPSVLIELGFISSPEEEKYLVSENGTSTLARGIYNAIVSYKDEQLSQRAEAERLARTARPEGKPVPKVIPDSIPEAALEGNIPLPIVNTPTPSAAVRPKATPEVTKEKVSTDGKITFAVQILTSTEKLKPTDYRFKGLKDAEHYVERGIYKYIYGSSDNYEQVLKTRRTIASKFKDAWIVAFQNGKRIDTNQAVEAYKQQNKR